MWCTLTLSVSLLLRRVFTQCMHRLCFHEALSYKVYKREERAENFHTCTAERALFIPLTVCKAPLKFPLHGEQPLHFPPSHQGSSASWAFPATSKESLWQQATDWHTLSPLQTIHTLMDTFLSRNSYRSSHTDSLDANRECVCGGGGLPGSICQKQASAQTLSLLVGGTSADSSNRHTSWVL